MDIRLEKEYERLISNLYVVDGEEYISAAEAEIYLEVGYYLTDAYDEFFIYNENTGEYDLAPYAWETLNEMEVEIFGDCRFKEDI